MLANVLEWAASRKGCTRSASISVTPSQHCVERPVPQSILYAHSDRNLMGRVEKYLQVVLPGLLARDHRVRLLYERPVDLENGSSIRPRLAGEVQRARSVVLRSV